MAKKKQQTQVQETEQQLTWQWVQSEREPDLHFQLSSAGDVVAAVPSCPYCVEEPVHFRQHRDGQYYVYRIGADCYKRYKAGELTVKDRPFSAKIWPAEPALAAKPEPAEEPVVEPKPKAKVTKRRRGNAEVVEVDTVVASE